MAKQDTPLFTVTLPAKRLADAMTAACTVVEARTTIPILEHARLAVTGDGLEIAATNMDQGLAMTVSAAVEGGGMTTAPAARLRAMAQALAGNGGGSDVTLTATINRLTVTGAHGTRYTLGSLPGTDFPAKTVASVEGGVTWDTTPGAMIAAAKAIEGAVGKEESRYYLCGIHIHPEHQGIPATLVALDGHRCAMVRDDGSDDFPVKSGDGAWPKGTVIVPPPLWKAVTLMDRKQPLTVRLNDRAMEISQPGIRYRSNLIDGQFPDYVRFIPNGSGLRLVVSLRDMAAALARVSPVAGLNETLKRGVRFEIPEAEPKGKGTDLELALFAQGPQGQEEVSTTCPATLIGLHGTRGGFFGANVDYMAQAVSSLAPHSPSGLVEITANMEAGTAILVTPAQPAGEEGGENPRDRSHIHFVMPLRA